MNVKALSFKVADRLGIMGRIYFRLSSLINQHILARNTLDMERIADIYDALDQFWLKHRDEGDKYNTKQLLVIVGSVIESLRDNHLSSSEVRAITAHIIRYWDKEKAETKVVVTASPSPAQVAIDRVEQTALKAVKVYDKLNQPSDVARFVATAAPLVSRPLPIDRVTNTLNRFFR